MVAQVQGGGWDIADFSPDGRRAVAINYISVTKSNPFLLDLASGAMTPIGDHSRDIAYGGAEFAPRRDACGSPRTRARTSSGSAGSTSPPAASRRSSPTSTGTSRLSTSPTTAASIAFVTNEAGISRLRLLDPRTGARAGSSPACPPARSAALEIAPWGTIGFSLSSARSPSDAYSVDPRTLAVTRWTRSETGGLDAAVNVEPELIEVRSFDGETVSGFLYRPDRGALPRPPAADRQHPWRAGGPVAPGLPGPQQLSDQRARHRHLLPQCPRLDRLRQALRQPRQRPGAAREFRQGHRRLPRPARTAIRRSTGAASRSPAAPMAAICATPRRSATATGCAPPIASSPSPTG